MFQTTNQPLFVGFQPFRGAGIRNHSMCHDWVYLRGLSNQVVLLLAANGSNVGCLNWQADPGRMHGQTYIAFWCHHGYVPKIIQASIVRWWYTICLWFLPEVLMVNIQNLAAEILNPKGTHNLVGGWATPLKNISQLGWLFPIYGKIKNVPNHQPVIVPYSTSHEWEGFRQILGIQITKYHVGGCRCLQCWLSHQVQPFIGAFPTIVPHLSLYPIDSFVKVSENIHKNSIKSGWKQSMLYIYIHIYIYTYIYIYIRDHYSQELNPNQ